jgi:hypothetical protein
MTLYTPFQDLSYELRKKSEAEERFLELIIPGFEQYVKTKKIKGIKPLEVAKTLVKELEKEKNRKHRKDCSSINVNIVVQNIYQHMIADKNGANIQINSGTKNIAELTITQPGVEAWKLLRLCYLKEKDYQDLAIKDPPRVLVTPGAGIGKSNWLLEGNTRCLYAYLHGTQDIHVMTAAVTPREIAQQIAMNHNISATILEERFGNSSVNALQQHLYNDLIERYKELKIKK